MNIEFIFFNQNTGLNAAGMPVVSLQKQRWFRDKTFRQAISCAIDREQIVREAYGGRAQRAYSFVSSENKKWINPDVPRFAYDPTRARLLLAQIGLEDRDNDGILEDTNGAGLEFTLFTNTLNPPRAREAALIVEDLHKAGLKVHLQIVEFDELLQRVNENFNYDCILMGLGGGVSDPASHLNVLKSDEPMHQWFPNQRVPSTQWEARVDELMDAQMRTLDFNKRKQMFDEVQAILAEQQPMISTVSPFYFAAVRTDIGNVRPSVSNPYHITWNVQELYFKK